MSSPAYFSTLELSQPPATSTSTSSTTSSTRKHKSHHLLPYSIDTNEELTWAMTGSTLTPPRSRTATRVPLSTTHEVRLLRSQVVEMEEELRRLNEKWTTEVLDPRTLALAQHSAREKHKAKQSEQTHQALQQMLLQQQLVFATLQSAMARAPLHSSGQAIFEALHFNTHLNRNPNEREQVLLAHHQRSIAALPSIVEKLTQMAINKVVASQKEDKQMEQGMPLSQIDVTGCRDSTLISSVFITKIPHTSLEEVYAAVMAYFDGIPTSMKRHFNVNAERVRLNSEDSPVVYRRSTFQGAGLPAIVNNVICSELTSSHGMVHIDAIVDDPLHPVHKSLSSQYGIGALTVTPQQDAVPGQPTSVTLRWVVVYHYNMLPDDLALKKDLEIIRPLLNGDLLTATVCDYIQQHQQQLLGPTN